MKRILSLDVIKSLSIVLVMTIHTIVITPFFPRTWWSNIFTLITITCVPLFIMVNGALLLNRPLDWSKWGRRLVTLVALTLFWKLLLVAFCYFFWQAGGSCSPSLVAAYLLGGAPPYPQIGYTWFLDMYVGLQLLFPLVKLLYDLENKRYLVLLLAIICAFPVGGETLFMLMSPVGTFTGHSGLAGAFLNLTSYAPFTLSSVYLVYFVLGGFLFARFGRHVASDSKSLREKRFIFASGAVCLILLYAINRYQVHYAGQMFDIAQKYTNLFSIVVASALFVLLISRSFGTRVGAAASFIGKRTFGIFILEAVPIRVLDLLVGSNSTAGSIIPNGSTMPEVLAMVYLWALIILMVLITAAAIYVLEQIPVLRRLLPR